MRPEVAPGSDADRQRAPDPGEQVGGDRAYHVIQLEELQEPEAGGADNAADAADDDCPIVIGHVRACRYGYQPGDGPIEHDEDIDPAKEWP